MTREGAIAPGLTSTGGSVTKRIESELEVIVLSLDPNGNLIMMIVIENRGSR